MEAHEMLFTFGLHATQRLRSPTARLSRFQLLLYAGLLPTRSALCVDV